MQVIHALVQVALRWREEGGIIEREGRNSRKGESSTRPPRGVQVDGLPRVVSSFRNDHKHIAIHPRQSIDASGAFQKVCICLPIFDISSACLKPSGQQSKTHKRRRDQDQTVRLTCRFRFCSRLQKLMLKNCPIYKITTKFRSSGCLAFRLNFPRFRTYDPR